MQLQTLPQKNYQPQNHKSEEVQNNKVQRSIRLKQSQGCPSAQNSHTVRSQKGQTYTALHLL
uniref:Uncharacterized protein n=1 Tax=Rhizophora mucronata TaxID=61149 RepID=A0A2P2IU43_RHIMU